jgi:hypothetical protein
MSERMGLKNLVPGSKAYQIAESMAYELMMQEADQEEYGKSNSIAISTGSDLDRIGEDFFRVSRLDSIRTYTSSRMKAIKFYVDSGLTFGSINYDSSTGTNVPMDITIPEGTTISGTRNGATYRFRVTADTVLSSDDSEAYVPTEIIQGSLSTIPSNTLKTHSFTNYTQNLNRLLKVTNPVPISTGREKEEDEDFRYRIPNALKVFVKTNTPSIYELLTNLPEVSNVYIDEAANGGGTFTVYVQGITPVTEDSLLEDVQSLISDTISPWVISYNITKPNYIGLYMSINITVRESVSASFAESIKNSIDTFINNFYGEKFYVNSILSLVNSLSSKVLTSSFNYVRVYTGDEDSRRYTEINFEETPNPVLYINSKEKLIVEQVSNSISVTATV